MLLTLFNIASVFCNQSKCFYEARCICIVYSVILQWRIQSSLIMRSLSNITRTSSFNPTALHCNYNVSKTFLSLFSFLHWLKLQKFYFIDYVLETYIVGLLYRHKICFCSINRFYFRFCFWIGSWSHVATHHLLLLLPVAATLFKKPKAPSFRIWSGWNLARLFPK